MRSLRRRGAATRIWTPRPTEQNPGALNRKFYRYLNRQGPSVGRALPADCRKTSCEGVPRRVPAAAAAGIKSKSVISGDMCLGNDTSHGGRGDFFARKRTPSAMQPFSKKRLCRFFDTLQAGPVRWTGPACFTLPRFSEAPPATRRTAWPGPGDWRCWGRRRRSPTCSPPGG